MTTITWTRPMLERLKAEHAKAEKFGEPTFQFEGHRFVTNYAKYLIEHLEKIL